MGRHQVPGRVFGHTTGAELDRVARYLARIVARDDLPEKIMVYHQLAARIVRRESGLQPHKGIVDDQVGRRHRAARREDPHLPSGQPTTPSFVHAGFKLFFTEDKKSGRLMRPEEILDCTRARSTCCTSRPVPRRGSASGVRPRDSGGR